MDKKKLLIVIISIIGFGLLVTGVVFEMKAKLSCKKSEITPSSDTVETDTALFTKYDTNDLLSSIKKENYYDERSGFVFHVPDGFSVDDKSEYLILKNANNSNGCIVVYLYSDMEVSDGIEVYDALYGLKDRTSYYIDGNYHKCVLYDSGQIADETIGGHNCRVETTSIHLKDINPALCKAVYFHTTIEGSGVCIGSIVKNDAGEDESAYFNDCAYDILNNIGAVHYLGNQPAGNASYMDLSVDMVDGMEIQYPTGWNKYTTKKGYTVYKSKTAKNDQYQFAAILVSQFSAAIGNAADPDFNTVEFLRWNHGYSIGDALCQNSEIENYFTFNSLIEHTHENKEINGYSFLHVVCNGTMSLSESKKISSLPDKENVSVDAYFVTIDNITHCYAFIGSTVRNNVEMEFLGERCLEAIR